MTPPLPPVEPVVVPPVEPETCQRIVSQLVSALLPAEEFCPAWAWTAAASSVRPPRRAAAFPRVL